MAVSIRRPAGESDVSQAIELLTDFGTTKYDAKLFVYFYAQYYKSRPELSNAKIDDMIDQMTLYLNSNSSIESWIFSDEYYCRENPDVGASGVPPLWHYVVHGRKEGRHFHSLVRGCPDDAYQMSEPNEGDDHPRSGYHAFLEGVDRAQWSPVVNIKSINDLEEFRDATNLEILKAIYQIDLNVNPLFDRHFYEKQCEYRNINVKDGMPGIVHYITVGWKLGLDPHPMFDTQYWWTEQKGNKGINPKSNPLSEFIQSTDQSAYSPSPFIDFLHLRHIMVTTGYEYQNDYELMISAFEAEWVNIHPHVHRGAISVLAHEIDRENADVVLSLGTLADLQSLVSELRVPTTSSKSRETESVEISVVILDYNKPIYTLLSAYSAVRECKDVNAEILIVENGSEPFFVEIVRRYIGHCTGVKLLSNTKNLFFGEGNNLAIDQANGSYVLLLNNDAVLSRGSVRKLIKTFELETTQPVGMVSPIIIHPNGRIQEIGGSISGCGQVIQKYKNLRLSEVAALIEKRPYSTVDYASAACVMLSRSVVRSLLGFDPTFDPFYYEDTDLCARAKAAGYEIVVSHDILAVHVENGSTKDYLGDAFFTLIAAQKQKFANRWANCFDLIKAGVPGALTPRVAVANKYQINTLLSAKPGRTGKSCVWVYTPFPIQIGGGERYILSIAAALAKNFEVWLLTNQPVSQAKVAMTMDDLGLPSAEIHLATLRDTTTWCRPELYFAMGNEIEPPTPPYGRVNIFHCQFPFPLHHSKVARIVNLAGYDRVIVNSDFTKERFKGLCDRYGLSNTEIVTIAPPIRIDESLASAEADLTLPTRSVPRSLLTVGRFIANGHTKRQDIVLDIFETLKRHDTRWNCSLVGGLSSNQDDRNLFAQIAQRAEERGAVISANTEPRELDKLYRNSSFYVHATGFEYYPGVSPEKMEHFGISVVEAMSAGLLPIVYRWGGPGDLVRNAGVGSTFETVTEAVQYLLRTVELPDATLGRQRQQCVEFAAAYRESVFQRSIIGLVGELTRRPDQNKYIRKQRLYSERSVESKVS